MLQTVQFNARRIWDTMERIMSRADNMGQLRMLQPKMPDLIQLQKTRSLPPSP